MSMDAPEFLYNNGRKGSANQKKFLQATKEDIIETIRFLYKRGMWSKYHYTHWTREANSMESEEELHLWWDAIVGGAMFETEPMLETKKEAMEEVVESNVPGYDKIEKSE